MNQTPDIDSLVPISEGFTMVGLRQTKGFEEVKKGRLKVVRNGRRTFLRQSEIERYIKALEDASSLEDASGQEVA